MKTLFKKMVRFILGKLGLTIIKQRKSYGYLSAEKIIAAAKKADLSICDYLENKWGSVGRTQKVVDYMADCGAFDFANQNIVEIGPGTGRYIEKILEKCSPVKYESYETAKDWAEWLKTEYPIVSHDADGITLKETPDKSADLVHAHGVFVYLPLITSYRYFKEIWRITRKDGFVVFDIISEECLDESIIDRWIEADITYPCFLSRNYVVSRFTEYGFSIVKTFRSVYGEGLSEYLIFKRDKIAD